ncbi:hypothetical protein C2G38_2195670 [Gigaspora rosea]|uniref:Uncharacterized protein n=1 Tax=Gigaspora rosea TaxID=44941 RepID=A0A397UXB4_9GLOM|nr:hypothetical protein C2G38_2195670 [Gigaspora rosea]
MVSKNQNCPISQYCHRLSANKLRVYHLPKKKVPVQLQRGVPGLCQELRRNLYILKKLQVKILVSTAFSKFSKSGLFDIPLPKDQQSLLQPNWKGIHYIGFKHPTAHKPQSPNADLTSKRRQWDSNCQPAAWGVTP